MNRNTESKKITPVLHKEHISSSNCHYQIGDIHDSNSRPQILVNSNDEFSFYAEKLRKTNVFLSLKNESTFTKQVINLKDTHSVIPKSFDWLGNCNESIVNMLTRVPIESLGQVPNKDWSKLINGTGEKIAKKYVHKENVQNILISKPVSVAEILYFSMEFECSELRFDHPSDHVQGILIIEALRQTGIASAHLHGVAIDSHMVMTSVNMNFKKMLELDLPILIRTTTNLPQVVGKSTTFWVAFEVLQAEQSCVTGGWTAKAFPERAWNIIRRRSRR